MPVEANADNGGINDDVSESEPERQNMLEMCINVE